MIVCIAGKNRIAIEATSYLLDKYKSYTVKVCLNKTDDGIDAWQPSLRYFCLKERIDIISLEEAYEIENGIFISLEFDRLVKVEKFKHNRIYNIHFSLLPAYKGMFTSIFPIRNGEHQSGVTLHCIDNGIDTGDIIDNRAFVLNNDINSRELYELYLDNSIELFKANVDNLLNNKINFTKQPSNGASYYSKLELDFKDLKVNLNKTAQEIHNQVRAYAFRDYQLPVVFGFEIFRSKILEQASEGKPGTIVFQDAYKIIVNTIDYNIELSIDQLDKLIIAGETGDIELYKELIQNDYPVRTRTSKGWDLLIIACYNRQSLLVSLLLDDGWNINTCNYKGTTAAMYAMTAASMANDLTVLQVIMERKPDCNLTDNSGKTIFEYAAQYKNESVINYLNEAEKLS